MMNEATRAKQRGPAGALAAGTLEVAVVIVNYNTGRDLAACLDSLRTSGFKDFVVVVVDNASHDGSPVSIPQRYPEVVYLYQDRNLGWGAANNIGIRWAKENGIPYVWLLNADTLVESEALERLMAAVRSRSKPVLAGAHLMHYDRPDQEQYAGSWIDVKGLRHGLCESLQQFHALPLPRRWLWGTALMIPASAFDRIGYLPEEYFVYCEDMAFSVRAAHAGMEQIIVEDAIVRHRSHARAGVVKLPLHYYYYITRNQWLFWDEVTPWPRKPVLWRRQILKLAHEVLRHQRLGHEDVVRALVQGFTDGLKGRTGAWDGRTARSAAAEMVARRPAFIVDVLEGRFDRIAAALMRRMTVRKACER